MPHIAIETNLSLTEKLQSLNFMNKMLVLLACIFVPLSLFLFGGLGELFLIILAGIVTFVFLLCPMGKAAKCFGAKNVTYMRVYLSQIVVFLLFIGTALFIVLKYLTLGWISLIIVIGASYAKILGMTFFRDIGITVNINN